MQNNSMNQKEVIDTYFQEHRAKIIDIAAFLDRVDRCEDAAEASDDFRIKAMHACIKELQSNEEGRVERILLLLSDQTTKPIDSAGIQGAYGAPEPKP
jgi:hypothetical protein